MFTSPHQMRGNVRIEIVSFNNFKSLIQKKYDFKINIEDAYKLTDFKPAYGEIFQDYIIQYDFWGFTDIDLIYGDFDKFINNEILKSFDKIFVHGHLSIIKNKDSFNSIYKKDNYYNQIMIIDGVTKKYKNFSKVSIIFGTMQQYRDPSF